MILVGFHRFAAPADQTVEERCWIRSQRKQACNAPQPPNVQRVLEDLDRKESYRVALNRLIVSSSDDSRPVSSMFVLVRLSFPSL